MPYSIQFTSRALRDLRAIDRPVQQRLRQQIDRLSENPFPANTKKLHGHEPYHRIRVGNYRVIYEVDGEQLRVIVIKIGHRKNVYR
jgi:mRNA interferase RelE/StbE